MGIGEILDQAIRLYRNNFFLFVGILAVFVIPLLVIRIVVGVILQTQLPANRIVLSNEVILVFALVSALSTIYQISALSIALSHRYLGEPASLREASLRAFIKTLPVFSIVMVLATVSFLATIGGSLPDTETSLFSAFRGSNSLTFLICVPMVHEFIDNILLFVVLPITVENKGALGTWIRSVRLVRNSLRRTFLTNSLLSLFSWLLLGIATMFSGFLMAIIVFPLISNVGAYLVVNTLLQGLSNLLFSPIRYSFIVLFYYDLRIRKEGFDLELRAKQLAQGATA